MTPEPFNLPGAFPSPTVALRDLSRRLAAADATTVVIASDLVVASRALAPLTHDPFAATALLVRPASESADVRVRHHLVTSVGSRHHAVAAPDHRSVGAMTISASDGPTAAALVDDLASAIDEGAIASDGSDLLELVAVAVARGGVTVKAVDMVDVPWFRAPADPDEARREAGSTSDDRIAQLQANRADDGFYSTFVVRKASKPLTRLALRLGWSPNAITVLSFAIGIGAAGAFALGSRWALVLGAVLLQLSLVVDCVDGEVARATRTFSALGAWLDASTDRVKEFLAYAGLAIGAARFGADIWWLAVVLVVLQTTRHMSDYDFSRIQRMREAFVPVRDVRLADDGASGTAGGWSVSGAMEMSTRMNRRDAVRWFKRAIHLPIGERWLIISVVAAILGPTWALGVLLVAGLLALVYVTAGRSLRTFTWHGPTPSAGVTLLSRQGDSGPLLSIASLAVPSSLRLRWWQHRAAWAVPAMLRLVELGTVALVALVWFPSVVVAAFWWMAVVAFHHYDTLYRAMQDAASPRSITWIGLGWEGRTILVIALAALGLTALGAGLLWGAWLMALLFVVISSVQWLSVQSRGRS
ncbi:MAG: CDP-alcohol phosphatidyltransferase family protein [Actinobacteria bacterium]|nr:CDP-alcohol phosphatidyltransferase family protein [Actinomycetota bacterium]